MWERALDTTLKDLRPQVYRYYLSLGIEVTVCRNLFQDTIVEAIKRLSSLKNIDNITDDAASSWIWSIIRRQAKRHQSPTSKKQPPVPPNESVILVRLRIKAWTLKNARITLFQHDSLPSGSGSKNVESISLEKLQRIIEIQKNAKVWHEHMTWQGKKGSSVCVISSTNLIDYESQMKVFQNEFEEQVKNFLDDYECQTSVAQKQNKLSGNNSTKGPSRKQIEAYFHFSWTQISLTKNELEAYPEQIDFWQDIQFRNCIHRSLYLFRGNYPQDSELLIEARDGATLQSPTASLSKAPSKVYRRLYQTRKKMSPFFLICTNLPANTRSLPLEYTNLARLRLSSSPTIGWSHYFYKSARPLREIISVGPSRNKKRSRLSRTTLLKKHFGVDLLAIMREVEQENWPEHQVTSKIHEKMTQRMDEHSEKERLDESDAITIQQALQHQKKWESNTLRIDNEYFYDEKNTIKEKLGLSPKNKA